MQFSVATLLPVLLPALAAALPQGSPSAPLPTYTLKVAGPGIPAIDQKPITASGGSFWVNRAISAQCDGGSACADTTATGVNLSGGLANMASTLGGQKVYVKADGSLSYTTTSSPTVPAGAVVQTFTISSGINRSPSTFEFQGLGARHFVACPVSASNSTQYKIFATVSTIATAGGLGDAKIADCLSLNIVADVLAGATTVSQYN